METARVSFRIALSFEFSSAKWIRCALIGATPRTSGDSAERMPYPSGFDRTGAGARLHRIGLPEGRTDDRAERYERLRIAAEALAGLKPQEIRCLLLKAEES